MHCCFSLQRICIKMKLKFFKVRLNEEDLLVHPFWGHTRKRINQYLGKFSFKRLDALISN